MHVLAVFSVIRYPELRPDRRPERCDTVWHSSHTYNGPEWSGKDSECVASMSVWEEGGSLFNVRCYSVVGVARLLSSASSMSLLETCPPTAKEEPLFMTQRSAAAILTLARKGVCFIIMVVILFVWLITLRAEVRYQQKALDEIRINFTSSRINLLKKLASKIMTVL